MECLACEERSVLLAVCDRPDLSDLLLGRFMLKSALPVVGGYVCSGLACPRFRSMQKSWDEASDWWALDMFDPCLLPVWSFGLLADSTSGVSRCYKMLLSIAVSCRLEIRLCSTCRAV